MTESKPSHMYDVKPDTFPDISTEMDKRAISALNHTWDAIAYDILVDDNGKYDESKSIRRNEVVELVQDANHMETYGGDFDAACYVIWLSRFKPTYYKRFIKQAFPFQWYGS